MNNLGEFLKRKSNQMPAKHFSHSSSIVFYKLTLFLFFGLRTEMGKAIDDKPLIEALLWNKDSPEKN